MLEFLRIRNLALMDAVELEFGQGFIAVTGETGAGKSVLLGALALLSGSRADKTIIRQGEETCEVEAVIAFPDTSAMDAVLASMDLPPCDDGSLVLRRTVSRSKAARVHINGTLTTLARLQELGMHWIDFHGPGEPQKLFSERWQLRLLDRFARNGSALEAYREDFRKWRALAREMEELRESEQLGEDERAFLESQIAAIDTADLSDESVAELERDHARLTGAQDLSEAAASLAATLGDDDDGVSTRLGTALHTARRITAIDSSLQPLADRLESLIIETADLAAEFSDVVDAADIDESTAASIEERMARWLDLKRKYGGDVSRILAKRGELAGRLERQGDIEGSLRCLEKQAAEIEVRLSAQAEDIRRARLTAARELSKACAGLLLRLGFRKARFTIEVEREDELREYGNCSVSFRFSPNAGQDLLPLNKIASSGELARVMLALKAVLAQVDATPVLVFDEVDANVGGEIAREVGAELAKLGTSHQVFCVTHLPQVAAAAVSHFVVQKAQTDDATAVAIRPLHPAPAHRLEEIARMLGDRSSKIARQHAKALLSP
ncbi:MAG: DNA repair protein RecN [Opitutales bacterium]|nr:DNA repair protein RecN [Opitutales bacterium]